MPVTLLETPSALAFLLFLEHTEFIPASGGPAFVLAVPSAWNVLSSSHYMPAFLCLLDLGLQVP